jgi:hypothetical protein
VSNIPLLHSRSVLILFLQILRDYATQHLELSRICVTSDSSWMICVGKALQDDKVEKYGIIGDYFKAHISRQHADFQPSLGLESS